VLTDNEIMTRKIKPTPRKVTITIWDCHTRDCDIEHESKRVAARCYEMAERKHLLKAQRHECFVRHVIHRESKESIAESLGIDRRRVSQHIGVRRTQARDIMPMSERSWSRLFAHTPGNRNLREAWLKARAQRELENPELALLRRMY